MQLDELKKGFWGYQKEGVFQYITAREEEFSRRLREKEAQADQALQRAQTRVQELEQEAVDAWSRVRALEQELQSLREERDALRKQQAMVADALLDARAYAGRLREESMAREEDARAQLRCALDRDLAELSGYRNKISALRLALQSALEGFDRRSEELERQAEVLASASPSGLLTLLPVDGGKADAG